GEGGSLGALRRGVVALRLSAAVVAALALLGLMALVIVRLPAGLVDYGVRHLTDGQLRVVQTQGSVWRGQGVLASSEASPRLTAARLVAWRTELELYRLAVRLRLSEHGREQLVLTVAPTGLAIEKLGLD